VLNNAYQIQARLFVIGEEEVESSEGITQRDLAMAMYALSITPLIRGLRSDELSVKHVWFADDCTGVGKVKPLRRRWQCLSTASSQMGYYPNASKTHLIVKQQF